MVDKFVDFVIKRKKLIISSILILTAVMGTLGFLFIGINPDLTDIVPKSKENYKMLVDFLKSKATSNVLTVALYTQGDVEGGKEALKTLKKEFEKTPYIKETMRFDVPELLIKYGIFTLKSGNIRDILNYFEKLRSTFNQAAVDFRFWKNMGLILNKVNAYIENYVKRKGFNEYIMVSPSGDLIIMNFLLKALVTDVGGTVEAVKALRKIAKSIQNRYGYTIKLTGGPVFTYESHIQVRKDFAYTTMLSLLFISLLLYLTLGSLRTVAYLFLSMLSAMAITVGAFYFIFGEINIITSFVNAMVIGLGIDFGIHLTTRLNARLRGKMELEEAIKHSIEETIAPSLISAATTASAFLVMLFSGSPAFSQMGIMASLGIAIFFAVMFLFIPALYSFGKMRPKVFHAFELFIRIVDIWRKRKIPVVVLIMIALALSYFGFMNISNYWYTPPGLAPSNSEAQKTFEDIRRSFKSLGLGDIVIAVKDFSELYKTENILKKDPLFSKTSSVIDIVGDLSKETAKKIREFYGDIFYVVKDPILSALFRKVGIYQEMIEMLKVVENSKSFSSILNELKKDLPMFFYDYEGKTYNLIYLQTRRDLYSNNMIKIVFDDLLKKVPKKSVLGYAMLFYNVMEDIQKSITEITVFISIVILLIVLVGSRSLKSSFFMLVVLILSIFTTFGMAYFLGIHSTFMTLLVIPIMIGIGVDSMIHLNHTVSTGKEDITRTEKAVSISMFTTIVAFGSFALARGKLLKEFGSTVAIGLFVSLVLSIFLFLPMIERRR